MSIADELEKLDQLRAKGTLTEDEFVQAKAKLLSASSPSDQDQSRALLQQQLVELRIQNQIAQIDRDWDVERRRHQMTGTYGLLYTPSLAMGLTIGVAGSLFGLFWMYTAQNFPAMIHAVSPYDWQFPAINNAVFVVGVLIMLVSLARGLLLSFRAIRYNRAYRAYQVKRERAGGSEVRSGGTP